VQDLLQDAGTAAVAPAYRDRATGLRGKHLRLDRWRLRYLPREFGGIEPVSFVINSMSVWRTAALRRIGSFDEGLRIDHVDTDYCLRARAAGLGIFVAGGHEFLHAIGERRRFRLFGREMQAGGHAPPRRFLIGRNTVWLMRRWLWREPAFAFLCFTRLGYEVAGILLAEDRKPAKLWALLRGAGIGLLSRRLA
jgi:rhamnosyltransferase